MNQHSDRIVEQKHDQISTTLPITNPISFINMTVDDLAPVDQKLATSTPSPEPSHTDLQLISK
jgi:hypothetical protein